MADENASSAKYENTPKEVIANTARFNRQFLDKQLGGTPIMASIGKMLTVMGDQESTIRRLSGILGREHNDQQLHDMHNELFGGLIQVGSGREGMELGGIANKLIMFIHEQNQQIQALVDEISRKFDETKYQTQSSS